MSTPIHRPRLLLTYIPRDTMRLRARVLVGGWNGDFEEVDVQCELFSDEQTGASLPRTELVEIAADGFGYGPAFRITDLDPSLHFRTENGKRYALPDAESPAPVAHLHETGKLEGYPREWQTFPGNLAVRVLAEKAV